MPSRRTHTNSHHGCKECKASRVKCDENQPQCSRCARRKQSCTYVHLGTTFNPFAPPNSIEETPPAEASRVEQARSHTEDPLADVTSSPLAHQVQDQYLLDHYMAVVENEFDEGQSGLCLWRNSLSHFLPTHDYIYYIVLALSACHLAIATTDDQALRRRYVECALRHQNASMASFTPVLSDINADTCEPAVACGGLIVACAYALPLATENLEGLQQHPLQMLTDIHSLFTGVSAVYKLGWRLALDPNLSFSIRFVIADINLAETPSTICDPYFELVHRDLVEPLTDLGRKATLEIALIKMRKVWRNLFKHPSHRLSVVMWPGIVWQSFYTELDRRDPVALILLACWAPCLKLCQKSFWLGDWGQRMLNEATEGLGPGWEKYLQWPLDMWEKGMPEPSNGSTVSTCTGLDCMTVHKGGQHNGIPCPACSAILLGKDED